MARCAFIHICICTKKIQEQNTSRPVIYEEPLWILEGEEDEGYITE